MNQDLDYQIKKIKLLHNLNENPASLFTESISFNILEQQNKKLEEDIENSFAELSEISTKIHQLEL